MTASHGGLEIKELPKYLQQLDGSGETLFDAKTGAMRANPNSGDPSRLFQGDLNRYHSGDFHHYVETQHRFLTGQSQSFVDFTYDEEVRRAKEKLTNLNGNNTCTMHHDDETRVLVDALYHTNKVVCNDPRHTDTSQSATMTLSSSLSCA
uniref:Pre-glycoprotein polyprotein GP complex n=1 Tax=Lygus hesperus TaxID=30085 RepID=A0A0A9YWP8_LYGHE